MGKQIIINGSDFSINAIDSSNLPASENVFEQVDYMYYYHDQLSKYRSVLHLEFDSTSEFYIEVSVKENSPLKIGLQWMTKSTFEKLKTINRYNSTTASAPAYVSETYDILFDDGWKTAGTVKSYHQTDFSSVQLNQFFAIDLTITSDNNPTALYTPQQIAEWITVKTTNIKPIKVY